MSDSVDIFGHLLQYGAAVIACCAAFYTATSANNIAKKASQAAIAASKAAEAANKVSEDANAIAEKKVSASIELQFIQIAEKRIETLRKAFSLYHSACFIITVDNDYNAKDFAIISQTSSEIDLLMNLEDPECQVLKNLMEQMLKYAQAKLAGQEHAAKSPTPEYIACAQRILKRESDLLRSNIEKYNA